jgi:thiamine-phosphate pyrophosphorylase
MRTKPLLCLVSDRLRLADSVGVPRADAPLLLRRQLRAAITGGIDFLQIRERDLEAGALVRLVSDAVAMARGSATRVLVNDRADVAIACGAAGVHLRETSIGSDDVRRLSATFLVGRSVHAAEGVCSAGRVDYLIAGTVFATASKHATVATLGCAGLEHVVRAARGTAVLAIGGITAARIPEVWRAGVAGIAGIGAFIPHDDVADLETAVQKSVELLRSAFATAVEVMEEP